MTSQTEHEMWPTPFGPGPLGLDALIAGVMQRHHKCSAVESLWPRQTLLLQRLDEFYAQNNLTMLRGFIPQDLARIYDTCHMMHERMNVIDRWDKFGKSLTSEIRGIQARFYNHYIYVYRPHLEGKLARLQDKMDAADTAERREHYQRKLRELAASMVQQPESHPSHCQWISKMLLSTKQQEMPQRRNRSNHRRRMNSESAVLSQNHYKRRVCKNILYAMMLLRENPTSPSLIAIMAELPPSPPGDDDSTNDLPPQNSFDFDSVTVSHNYRHLTDVGELRNAADRLADDRAKLDTRLGGDENRVLRKALYKAMRDLSNDIDSMAFTTQPVQNNEVPVAHDNVNESANTGGLVDGGAATHATTEMEDANEDSKAVGVGMKIDHDVQYPIIFEDTEDSGVINTEEFIDFGPDEGIQTEEKT